jgi:hypothetical protein
MLSCPRGKTGVGLFTGASGALRTNNIFIETR